MPFERRTSAEQALIGGLRPSAGSSSASAFIWGDVVEECDGDLMGDGVNIATRLEGVAAQGTICLAEDAFRHLRSRLDLAIDDLGEMTLKNIPDPIRIYSLQVGLAAPARPAATAPAELSVQLSP